MVVEVQQADLIPDVDLTFTKAELQDVVPHDNDPVVISLVIAGKGCTASSWTKKVQPM